MKCAVIDLGDETVPVNGTLEETMISSGRSPDAYIFPRTRFPRKGL